MGSPPAKRVVRPKALVLYNRPADHDTAFLHADSDSLGELAAALAAAGYAVVSSNLEDDPDRVAHAVVVHRPTLIFHLIDHFEGDNTQHGALLGLLDLFGYVYTGSDPVALATCQDRVKSRVLLAEAELDVPSFVVIRDLNAIPDTEHLRFPVIVSQALDDVYDDARYRQLIDDREELEDRVRELATQFDLPFLVEEYLPGRRIQAIVLGNRVLEVLPLTELVGLGDGGEITGDEEIVVAQLGVDIAETVRQKARRAVRVLGCRDVAQVDFVLADDGELSVIDVRPQPDYFGDGPFRIAAQSSEHGFAGALALVLRTAHARMPAAELALHPIPAAPGEPEAEASAEVPEERDARGEGLEEAVADEGEGPETYDDTWADEPSETDDDPAA